MRDLVNITVVRPGGRPERLLSDVDTRTARAVLKRIATAHKTGVTVALERDRLRIESATTGTTVYTISPALIRDYRR